MSQAEKLKKRFLSTPIPKNFRWEELVRLMENLGFAIESGSGSARRFVSRERPELVLFIHQPHPQATLKEYQIRQIRQTLRENGILQ
ncbi:type II toxin-antitoxin system HicA family toxin [Acidithiobacillus caldus]|uniref:type II toxin-antitoxin system HicA family toxin n=2 Tax=Acidithiobacillus caldus TaxID=33059 RepID=UPI00056FCB29|nr:type II toxin-antitoxin system HicA family toxin [Acidithiobacillus caldus]MBU2735783.1 type II toxin-antitoxin system HicA family toxin [Acidithiobacillus caldus ATCC 51756]MBU2743734.1 type II toxin-antitoxin system HicA family toxin [Acidithiobacillus caldus]MBU2762383.1 type II toxin-antitoxin system HicA family toxin [Acidithiobacillus caldus]MBU2772297.1 type II toxin-antitoxin system HicA family toxin [Acidithiobacillus caldus]